MKLLLWIALIACVIWILRGKKAAVQAGAGAPAQPRAAVGAGEAMLACAHCGLHFPSSEAIVDGSGAVFCGEEHRRLHASR